MPNQRTTRRNFMKLAAGSTVAAGAQRFLLPTAQAQPLAEPSKPIAPNDHIQVATIGLGGMGNNDTRTAIGLPGVKLVAVADVYDGRLTHAKEVYGKDVYTTRDYREILGRTDIDAVYIATPDHWHQQITTDAVGTGKDVYVQKPMVHSIDEGHQVIDAQRRSNRIVQVGSQRVSSIVYKKVKDLIASGAIGEVNLVEASWNRDSAIGAWQYSIPPDASPATVDWDRFLGTAPKVPFEPVRLFRWRNYKDYGTGVAGDLFVHLFSGIHYVLASNGPVRVQSTGGLRYWRDGRDAADVVLGIYDYPQTNAHPAFNLVLKVNFADFGGGGEESFKFTGSAGSLSISGDRVTVTRARKETEPGYTIDTFANATQEAFLKEYRAKYPENPSPNLRPQSVEIYEAPDGYSDQIDHHRNFVEAIRTRRAVIEDPFFGLRAAGPALLTNSCYYERTSYQWDPLTMNATKG